MVSKMTSRSLEEAFCWFSLPSSERLGTILRSLERQTAASSEQGHTEDDRVGGGLLATGLRTLPAETAVASTHIALLLLMFPLLLL